MRARHARTRRLAAPAVVPQGPAARGPAAGEAAGGTAGEIRGDAQPVQARAQPIGRERLLERVFDIDLRRCRPGDGRARGGTRSFLSPRDINGVNLRENILSSRERAHVALRKHADHGIDEVWLRQI